MGLPLAAAGPSWRPFAPPSLTPAWEDRMRRTAYVLSAWTLLFATACGPAATPSPTAAPAAPATAAPAAKPTTAPAAAPTTAAAAQPTTAPAAPAPTIAATTAAKPAAGGRG